jgi:hypothetical protein
MKYLLTVLMVLTFITIGCDTNTTESNNEGEITEHSTINVKTATEYFNFSTNSGSADETSAHDVVFYAVSWQPAPQAPVISDPRFKAKDGMSIAVLKDTKMEDVTDVPGLSDFVTDYTTEIDSWYNMTDANIVLSNASVWVVNTADGKFPAFEITNYYDDQGVSGVFSIEWKYLSE